MLSVDIIYRSLSEVPDILDQFIRNNICSYISNAKQHQTFRYNILCTNLITPYWTLRTKINEHFSFAQIKSQNITKIDIPPLISFFLLIFTYTYYLSIKYKFGISDQNEQLPIIYRIMDDSYLINDWFVNQTEGISPRFFYAHFLAFFSNFIDIESLFFIVFIAFTILAIISIYGIAWELFKNHLISYFSIVLLLFGPHVALGDNWIFGSILVPSTIARALVLFGIYLYLKNQQSLCFIILGFSTLFEPLIGLLTIFVLIPAIWFTSENSNFETIKRIIKLFTLFLLFGIIGFAPILFTSSNISNIEIFNIITYIRHPHHYCPFSFPIINYVGFLLMLILFIFILALKLNPTNRTKHKFVILFIIFVGILNIIGTIFVEIIPISLIGKLQVFKINAFIAVFIEMYILNAIIICISYFIEKSHLNTAIKHLFENKLFVSILITALIISSMLFFMQIDIHNQKSEYDICYQWIQNNTENESIFLIPVNIDDFRLGANRAVVVDWKAFPFKDAAMLEWYSRINDVTNNKYEISNYSGFSSYSQMIEGYNSLNEVDINSLKEKYGADYIVVLKNKELEYPLLYSNDSYKIYKI